MASLGGGGGGGGGGAGAGAGAAVPAVVGGTAPATTATTATATGGASSSACAPEVEDGEIPASMLPNLPVERYGKVFSVGCFDIFHEGHIRLLRRLRQYGRTLHIGVHDDASIYALKKLVTTDKVETRVENLRPYVDELFIVRGTDPLPFLREEMTPADLRSCCYIRGDDMPDFPGRDWVESQMPVILIPYTQGISSSALRVAYNSGIFHRHSDERFVTIEHYRHDLLESAETSPSTSAAASPNSSASRRAAAGDEAGEQAAVTDEGEGAAVA